MSDEARTTQHDGLRMLLVGLVIGTLISICAMWIGLYLSRGQNSGPNPSTLGAQASDPAEETHKPEGNVTVDELRTALDRKSAEMSQQFANLTALVEANQESLTTLQDTTLEQRSRLDAIDERVGAVARMVAVESLSRYKHQLDEGNRLLAEERYEAAIAAFSEALTINPGASLAHFNRGMAHQALGNWESAYDDYLAARDANLTNYSPWNNLAWLLATCPQDDIRDGPTAVKYATEACELTEWKNFAALSSLAAAQAECNEFAEAVKRQEEALELAPEEIRPMLEEHKQQYLAERPFREAAPESD